MSQTRPRARSLEPGARRILAIAAVFPPRHGGSGRWLWELYRRLPPGSVHVLAGEAPGAAAFDSTHTLPITRERLAFASWGMFGSTRAYARALRTVARLESQTDPDVVHCAKALPEGLIAWLRQRLTGRPYWLFAHGEELTLARTSRELAWWTGLVLRDAARVVANSLNTARLLQADWRVSADRVTVLHPGVDTTSFVPAARDETARAALGWAGRTVVLTVGGLQRRKGQDMVIRALPAIRAGRPDVLYVMVGDGPDRAYLEALVREQGVEAHVQFRAAPDDAALVRVYQQCDVFVLANRQIGWDFEGFGIVLLEAQACGRAVVAGLSGGTCEAVNAPATGRLVDAETPGAVAAAILELLNDAADGAETGRRARAWVAARFDWTSLAREAGTLFEIMTSDRPAQSV